MKTAKHIGKIILIIIAAILAAVVLFLGYFSIMEYKPEEREALVVEESGTDGEIKAGQSLKVVSFNIGYGALSEDEDFFMDGGTKVRPDNKAIVEENMEGITAFLQETPADFYMIQETDIHSDRSFKINESEMLGEKLQMNRAFAYNYNCTFVPYPFPMIGHVEGGLTTLSNAVPESAMRYSLPVPFSWPIRLVNLKRALLVERFPVEGTDHELVLINLHLEAYDDGEGKAAQTKVLRDLLEEEYGKGNYVVAGGDFNQSFPGALEQYPLLDSNYWAPGILSQEDFDGVGKLVNDNSVPSCRLLNGPYDPEKSQYYCIDGFLVSDNVKVEDIKTLEESFRYSDHNPVELTFTLE